VVHLNELAEKYAERGLTVVAISKQAKADVEKFVEELKATHPVVCESTDSARAYGATGFPSSYLVGPNGRVAWAGHPGELKEEYLEETLGKVKLMPALTKGLASHAKNLEKLKYGPVLAKVAADLEAAKFTAEDDKTAAQALKEWLEWYAGSNLEAAEDQVGKGEPYRAYLVLVEVEESYKGHPLGTRAKAAISKLQADKAAALEIKAGQMLAQIRKELGDERDREEIAKALKPLLGKKYAETKAGKEAADLAAGRDPDARKSEAKEEKPKEGEGETGEPAEGD
jgi:hypothetical protein